MALQLLWNRRREISADDKYENGQGGGGHKQIWRPPTQEEAIKINVEEGRGIGMGMACRDHEAREYFSNNHKVHWPRFLSKSSWSFKCKMGRTIGFGSLLWQVFHWNWLLTTHLRLECWPKDPTSYFQDLVQDYKVLNRGVTNFKVSFVKRLFSLLDNVWIDEAPHQVNSIILSDVNAFCQI